MDAKVIDDPEKGMHLSLFERKHAAYLRKIPSFADWMHFNLFVPFTNYGGCCEYSYWIDFVEFKGDIIKMQPYSNFVPALKRLVHAWLCFALFFTLNLFASP